MKQSKSLIEKNKINSYQNLEPITSENHKKDEEKHEKTKIRDEIIEKKSPKKVDQSKTVIFDAISNNGDLEKRSSVFEATPLGSGISLMRRRKTNTLRRYYFILF